MPPLRIAGTLSGTPSTPIAGSLTASAGDTRLGANGTVALGARGVEAMNGRISLEGSDIAPWLTTLGVAVGQPIEGLPARLDAAMRWSPDQWEVTGLSGSLADSTVAATLTGTAGTPILGTVLASDVSGPWLQTLLVGTDASGLDATFGAGLLPQTAFDLELGANRIELEGVEISDLGARVSSDGAELRVAGLTATYEGSPLIGQAMMRNVAGVVSFDVVGSLGDRPLPEGWLVRGSVASDVAATGGGRSPREILSSLTGSGHVRLTDGAVQGLSPDVLAPIMLAADSQTDALAPETVAQLLRETGEGASFPLGRLDLPFRLGAGSLQFEPWSVTQPEAVLTGAVGASLANGALTGTLSLRPTNTETVADAEPPRVDYRLGGTLAAPTLEARPEVLVSYFGVRAFQREQARVEALREELAETARLRREARLYRERATLRNEARDARLAAEEAERRHVEELERARAEEAREAAAAAARRSAEAAAPTPSLPDLSAPVQVAPPSPSAPSPPSALNGLPGVRAPERF